MGVHIHSLSIFVPITRPLTDFQGSQSAFYGPTGANMYVRQSIIYHPCYMTLPIFPHSITCLENICHPWPSMKSRTPGLSGIHTGRFCTSFYPQHSEWPSSFCPLPFLMEHPSEVEITASSAVELNNSAPFSWALHPALCNLGWNWSHWHLLSHCLSRLFCRS